MTSFSILRHLLFAAVLYQFSTVSSVSAEPPAPSDNENSLFGWFVLLPYGPARIQASSPQEPWDTYRPGLKHSHLEFDYLSTRAYRYSTDYSNYIVLRSEPIESLFNYSLSVGSHPPTFGTDLVIGDVVFLDSVNPNATSPDLWDLTDGWQPMPLQVSILANNLPCFDDKTITIVTTDADGFTQNMTSLNTLAADLNGTLPITLEVTYAENPDYQLTLIFPPLDKIFYKLGYGPVQPEFYSTLLYPTIYFNCTEGDFP